MPLAFRKILSFALAAVLALVFVPSAAVADTGAWANQPGVAMVAAGDNHTFAIKEDGSLWAWGNNSVGQLGNGYSCEILDRIYGCLNRPCRQSNPAPFRINLDVSLISISTSPWNTFAIDTDGGLWAWGNNNVGQLGTGYFCETLDWEPGCANEPCRRNNPAPIRIQPDMNFESVSASSGHTFAIDTGGGLWAWGNNRSGQLGTGYYRTQRIIPTPTRVKPDTNFISVSADFNGGFAVDTAGGLWAWGINDEWSSLGNGYVCTDWWECTNEPCQMANPEPLRIQPETRFKNVVSSDIGTIFALETTGTLWAWGYNASGQLGNGYFCTDSWGDECRNRPCRRMSRVPERIRPTTNFVNISPDGWHTLAADTTGGLWAWGNNEAGTLGNGYFCQWWTSPNCINRPCQGIAPTPIRIQPSTRFASVAAGGSHSLAIDTAGGLWSWGVNGSGQLGNDCFEARETPVLIWPADGTPLPTPCPICELIEGCVCTTHSGIDYSSVQNNHLIVQSTNDDYATINLTTETLGLDGFIPAQFSTNGTRWRNVRHDTFTTRFPRLLNRQMTLHIRNDEGEVIIFPTINARPRAPRVAVNYSLDADPTGATLGYWLLTNRPRRGETPVAQRDSSIQIGLPALNARNRPTNLINEQGWGQFYQAPHNGIPVLSLPQRNARIRYLVRLAPVMEDNGTFTPASRTGRLTVRGAQRAPNFRTRHRAATSRRGESYTINLRAGIFSRIGAEEPTLHARENRVLNILSVPTGTQIEIWRAATHNRPASAKQLITRQ